MLDIAGHVKICCSVSVAVPHSLHTEEVASPAAFRRVPHLVDAVNTLLMTPASLSETDPPKIYLASAKYLDSSLAPLRVCNVVVAKWSMCMPLSSLYSKRVGETCAVLL